MPYYKEDFHRHDPDKGLYELLMGLVLAIWIIWLLASCSSCKTVSDVQVQMDSITSVSKQTNDTATIHTVYTDRLIDHYVNNTYVVSPLGDTVRTDRIERIYESVNTKQHDSIRILQATVDSLQHIKKQAETKVIEKQLTKWEQTKIDTYEYVMIALIACIAIIVWYIFYRIKNK